MILELSFDIHVYSHVQHYRTNSSSVSDSLWALVLKGAGECFYLLFILDFFVYFFGFDIGKMKVILLSAIFLIELSWDFFQC